MSATDHTLTDAERAMFERIEDTGDTQGLTWRVQELVAEARALADEESASRVALANQLATAEAEKEALRERVEYVRRDSNRRRVRQVRQLQGRLTELAGVAEERGYDVQAQMERAEAAEAALTGLVAAVEAVAEASLRDGRGGTWVHDEWFRALIDSDLRAIIPADATTALDAVKAQAAREALLAAADDFERERIERHEIVIAALDSKYDNGIVSGPAKFLRARADSIEQARP